MSTTELQRETAERPSYLGSVRIEQVAGPDRLGFLAGDSEPVVYGVHDEIAEHYKFDLARIQPRASTIDHIIGATAGCLGGTLGGALAARKIDADKAHLQIEASGNVFDRQGTLVLESIEVRYTLRAPADQHAAAERAHALHAERCPVARSLKGGIDITTTLELIAED
jgi:uncharacterized OsmC-like protein